MINIKYNSLTYEFVKNFIEVESNSGCKLISSKSYYKDTLTQLDIKCSCGEIFTTSFKRFKSSQSPKQQCNKCGRYAGNTNKRLTYNQVKNYIEVKSESNYKLLSKEYIKSSLKLKIECDKGHIFLMTYNNFQRGKRCPNCYGNKKYTQEEVFNIFKNNKCELLSKEYKNNFQKLDYVCSCGRKAKIKLSKFLSGQRCKICKFKKIAHTLKLNGSVCCSIQQQYLYNCINIGELNYLCDNYFLDIAFPEEKIYIEYDGGGHDLSVKYRQITETQFEEKEQKRWHYLKDNGWKEIRIISAKDYIPEDNKILEMITYAKQYLNTGHHYIKFDIDKNIIINSQGEFHYDFGQLRKIKKEDVIKILKEEL